MAPPLAQAAAEQSAATARVVEKVLELLRNEIEADKFNGLMNSTKDGTTSNGQSQSESESTTGTATVPASSRPTCAWRVTRRENRRALL